MLIDLTKMIYNNLYSINVEGVINVDDKYLENTDIRRISPVKVVGTISNNEEEYELSITVSGTMVLGCARTLKDVDYPFSIEINEIVGDNSSNNLEIIQNRLEIFPIIWQYILVDVPLRVLHPDAKEESLEGDGWRLITEEEAKKEKIDPRLSKLKDYIKE